MRPPASATKRSVVYAAAAEPTPSPERAIGLGRPNAASVLLVEGSLEGAMESCLLVFILFNGHSEWPLLNNSGANAPPYPSVENEPS